MSNILIIPDAHAEDGIENSRFTRLGRVIADRRPDYVVSIGDLFDMASLSSFDVGKKSFEGRRYIKDLQVGHDALKKIQAPIDELNKELAAKKLKKYNPKRYITLGNHENRINKAINSDPKLDGTMGIDDLRLEEFGFEVIPFLEPLLIDGVMFQHYMVSGGMDRPIGGENLGKAILKKYHSSCFQGHNHLLNLAWESNASGNMMTAGSVGCYFEHEMTWQSRAAQNNFWRGLVYLKGVKNGTIEDVETISMAKIKREY